LLFGLNFYRQRYETRVNVSLKYRLREIETFFRFNRFSRLTDGVRMNTCKILSAVNIFGNVVKRCVNGNDRFPVQIKTRTEFRKNDSSIRS